MPSLRPLDRLPQIVPMRRAFLMMLLALLVTLFAFTVFLWAAVSIFIPRLRALLQEPDMMRFGNCHIYAWLKYAHRDGDMVITPSQHCWVIPHAYTDDKEFVPHKPRKGLMALFHSLLFFGHVRQRREHTPQE